MTTKTPLDRAITRRAWEALPEAERAQMPPQDCPACFGTGDTFVPGVGRQRCLKCAGWGVVYLPPLVTS